MNVDQIYQLYRDEAFAEQFEDNEYLTFLAMPFSTRGGYPQKRIQKLFEGANLLANQNPAAELLPRRFSKLKIVNGDNLAAITITEEIIRQILRSHFFVGDITGNNEGVLVEIGLALALKPNSRICIFSQDGPGELHFDLAGTNVNFYSEKTLKKDISRALGLMAKSYEVEADLYIKQISSRLTSDSLKILKSFATQYANTDGIAYCIWEKSDTNNFKGDFGRVAFLAAYRELLANRLMWTDYESLPIPQLSFGYGLHATRLGWGVITKIWGIRMPEYARTDPNQKSSGPRLVYRHS